MCAAVLLDQFNPACVCELFTCVFTFHECVRESKPALGPLRQLL